MKTNPWMILSLVLACVCGFLVGLLVSQPAEVSAEPKHDWEYSSSYVMGQLIATRWDRNAEASLPEMMILTLGGEAFEVNTEVLGSPGKWCKAVILDNDAIFQRMMDAKAAELEAVKSRTKSLHERLNTDPETGLPYEGLGEKETKGPTDAEIEKQLEGQGLTEEEKEVLRRMLRELDN
ncbi:hypothetical protein OAN47_03575 [Planctomycetota bacterium]|nr:hypothetical protein [Planctomycetota bacterium]